MPDSESYRKIAAWQDWAHIDNRAVGTVFQNVVPFPTKVETERRAAAEKVFKCDCKGKQASCYTATKRMSTSRLKRKRPPASHFAPWILEKIRASISVKQLLLEDQDYL